MKRTPGRSRATLPALAVLVWLVPAETPAQGRFTSSATLSLTQVYDNNLFSKPSGAQKDLISRLTPTVEAGYRSTPFTLHARYAFDAEAYAGHPELSAKQVRQDASLLLTEKRGRLLTLSARATFSRTQRPAELNADTGLEALRGDARRFAVVPSLARRLGATTVGTLECGFTWDTVSGAVPGRTQVGRMELERRVSPRDSARAAYTLRRFAFGDTGGLTAQVFTVGWDRRLTRRLHLELEAGPRFSEGKTGPELSISLQHRFGLREMTLSYSRTQATAIGEAGAVDVESFSASFSRPLLGPLRIGAAPALSRNRRGAFEARVYRLSLDASWALARRLSLVGSYQRSLQQGSLTAHSPGDISHNILLLRLAASSGS